MTKKGHGFVSLCDGGGCYTRGSISVNRPVVTLLTKRKIAQSGVYHLSNDATAFLLTLHLNSEEQKARGQGISVREKSYVSASGLADHSHQLDTNAVGHDVAASRGFLQGPHVTRFILGNRALLIHGEEIRQLRYRCGQQDDRTTDPEYFLAANTLANRRCAAILIYRDRVLEACVLFYEHTRFGVGLGLFRGGDYIGECLVAAPEALRVHYVNLATQELLRRWRIHGVSITMKASVDACVEVMGPASNFRRFCGSYVQHKLLLPSTYEGMLASLGPRTRRSLAGKRQQLEKSASVQFVPVLEAHQALEIMLGLETKSMMPQRIQNFFYARYHLQRANPDMFAMGLRLPDGRWLSLLTGWRRNRVTYVDLQMNDANYKKESLSAVMRAFFLEHEIACKQQVINFVGGSSLLLRRYCELLEPCTDIFIYKPGLLARFFEWAARHARSGSVYERLKAPGEVAAESSQVAVETEA